MAQTAASLNNAYPFLQGGGEMGELIRSIDWSATALGAPDDWNGSLKVMAGMMLTTTFPTLICWGEDYLQLYNDAFRPILGTTKHPKAMGISARETFDEIWDTIGPMFTEVINGHPVGLFKFMVPMDRNGYVENCYFDFSYNPIRDETGHIGGIMVICMETTEKVMTLNDAKIFNKAAQQAQVKTAQQRDRLKQLLMQAPAGICILNGPDLVFELINPLYQQLFPGRNLLGKPILEALPEIKGQPVWEIMQQVYHSGKAFEGSELLVPLARMDNGHLENRYFNFVYQPRHDFNGPVDGILVFVFEVTEMVVASRELAKIQDSMKMAVTAAQLGTFDMDLEKNTMDWDARCRELFGINHQCNVTYEKDFLKGLHTDDRKRVESLINDLFSNASGNNNYDVEYRTIGVEDQKLRWVRAMGKVYFDQQGKPVRFIGSVMDITDRKVQEQRKDEFISIASHELKTPLTSIKAFNQLMRQTKDEGKLNGFIQKSAQHISRLEKLIHDLLDVSKINAGKMNYTMHPFCFNKMLEECVESAQHIAQSHQIILENTPEIIYTGDQFRLEQVVNNFLTNAIKYSPQNKQILVKAVVEQESIIVSVQDFGIGIAPASIDRLFERYYRVDNTAMRFEGLGLGLFISSEILKRHKGSFWIESELGKGSTFFLRLPLTESKKPEPIKNSATHYQDSTISIAYNSKYKRLDVDWTGFQNLVSVQHGCMTMLEMMKMNQVYKIVNDNTHVLGSWSEAVEWTGKEWFPMMEKAGLKYFALIYSPSVFSQLSAKKSIDVGIGNITAQYFTDINLAEDWINKCFPPVL